MLSHKQMVLAVGAAMLVSALAMVPRDANAWGGGRYRFYPIDLVDRVGLPGLKAPTGDAHAIRIGFRYPVDIMEHFVQPSRQARTGDAAARKATALRASR